MLLVPPGRHLALIVVVLVLTTVKDIAISPLWMLLVAAVVVFVILSPFIMVELLIEITTASLLRRISAITWVVKWWRLDLLAVSVVTSYLLLT